MRAFSWSHDYHAVTYMYLRIACQTTDGWKRITEPPTSGCRWLSAESACYSLELYLELTEDDKRKRRIHVLPYTSDAIFVEAYFVLKCFRVLGSLYLLLAGKLFIQILLLVILIICWFCVVIFLTCNSFTNSKNKKQCLKVMQR